MVSCLVCPTCKQMNLQRKTTTKDCMYHKQETQFGAPKLVSLTPNVYLFWNVLGQKNVNCSRCLLECRPTLLDLSAQVENSAHTERLSLFPVLLCQTEYRWTRVQLCCDWDSHFETKVVQTGSKKIHPSIPASVPSLPSPLRPEQHSPGLVSEADEATVELVFWVRWSCCGFSWPKLPTFILNHTKKRGTINLRLWQYLQDLFKRDSIVHLCGGLNSIASPGLKRLWWIQWGLRLGGIGVSNIDAFTWLAVPGWHIHCILVRFHMLNLKLVSLTKQILLFTPHMPAVSCAGKQHASPNPWSTGEELAVTLSNGTLLCGHQGPCYTALCAPSPLGLWIDCDTAKANPWQRCDISWSLQFEGQVSSSVNVTEDTNVIDQRQENTHPIWQIHFCVSLSYNLLCEVSSGRSTMW